MASYEMQESNLPDKEGKRILFPRMRLQGQADLDDMIQNICHASSFTPGDVKGMVRALAEEIAREMANGKSVKVDGIGIFSAALGLKKGIERETGEDGATRRNAMSIHVKDIHFKADKSLLWQTDSRCSLERSAQKFRKSSVKYTPEERLQIALKHLETHAFLTVADYCRLTGLLRNTAAQELKRWAADPASGIGSQGGKSQKVYVRKNNVTA